jgi:ribosome-binding protein aMBF1 (putative translation factor)
MQVSRGTNALRILDRLTGDDQTIRAKIETAAADLHMAQLIYDARKEAGLTQQELAQLVKTRQPVIARLEDADYSGHSMTMLRRIADALGLRIELRMVLPNGSKPRKHSASKTRRRKLVA